MVDILRCTSAFMALMDCSKACRLSFFVGDEVGGGFECGVGRGYNSVFVFFEVVLVLEVVEYELGVVLEGLYFIGELLEVIGELLEFLVGEL
jgi:hypothetical protein